MGKHDALEENAICVGFTYKIFMKIFYEFSSADSSFLYGMLDVLYGFFI